MAEFLYAIGVLFLTLATCAYVADVTVPRVLARRQRRRRKVHQRDNVMSDRWMREASQQVSRIDYHGPSIRWPIKSDVSE